jgi:hypothetical protein
MPKALERRLKDAARRKGLKGKRADRYTYGTLRAMGWKPKQERRNTRRK